MVVVLVLPFVLAAFVLGHRLGAATALPSLPVAVATATPAPTPGPSVEPLLGTATVSEDLRQAYYAAGAGTSVCTVRDVPRCATAVSRDLRYIASGSGEVDVCVVGAQGCPGVGGPTDVEDPYWRRPPARWPALPEIAVPTGHVIAVADLSTGLAVATLVRRDAEGRTTDLDQLPAPVNPGAQGIDYFDLGWLDEGRYLVLISRLAPAGFAEVPYEGAWSWRPLAIGLAVQPPPY